MIPTVFSFSLLYKRYNVVCVIQKTTLCSKLHPHAALLDLHPEICVRVYKRRYAVRQCRHRPLHAFYGELTNAVSSAQIQNLDQLNPSFILAKTVLGTERFTAALGKTRGHADCIQHRFLL